MNADDGTFYVCCNAFQVSDLVVYIRNSIEAIGGDHSSLYSELHV